MIREEGNELACVDLNQPVSECYLKEETATLAAVPLWEQADKGLHLFEQSVCH